MFAYQNILVFVFAIKCQLNHNRSLCMRQKKSNNILFSYLFLTTNIDLNIFIFLFGPKIIFVIHCITNCILYTVDWMLYTAYDTLQNDQCTIINSYRTAQHIALHMAPCKIYTPTAHRQLQPTHCTLHTEHWTLHTVHFILHHANWRLHTLHCTLHTLHYLPHIAYYTLYTLHSRFSNLYCKLQDGQKLCAQH